MSTTSLPPWVDVDEVSEPYDDKAAQRWQVSDDARAEWAMARLAAARAEQESINDQAQAWQTRLDQWYASARAQADRDAAFFEGLLIAYLRHRREADPQVKSIKLPSGRIASTGGGPRVEVIDVDVFAAWCAAHGLDDLVRRDPKPIMAEVRKALAIEEHPDGPVATATLPANADGEPITTRVTGVPGVRVVVPEVSYRAEPLL